MRLLRYFLANNLIKVHILPEHLFLNGHLFNLETGVKPAARTWKEEGIVLHYSWTGSRGEKFRKLDKFELNYLGISVDTDPGPPREEERLEAATPEMEAEKRASAGELAAFHAVTLHLSDGDPITLTCDAQSAVLRTILGTFFRPNAKGAKTGAVHLQLIDDMQSRDVFLRADRISRIEINPSLSEVALLKIAYADLGGYRILLMKCHRMIARVRRKLFHLKNKLRRLER